MGVWPIGCIFVCTNGDIFMRLVGSFFFFFARGFVRSWWFLMLQTKLKLLFISSCFFVSLMGSLRQWCQGYMKIKFFCIMGNKNHLMVFWACFVLWAVSFRLMRSDQSWLERLTLMIKLSSFVTRSNSTELDFKTREINPNFSWLDNSKLSSINSNFKHLSN